MSSRPALLSLCLTLLAPAAVRAQDAIFVVRHAEKADSSRDAPLSAQGHARAALLAEVLRESGVRAVFATEFQRTMHTAKPLADALALAVTSVPANDQAALIERVRTQRSGAVLIVGHSNTIPAILKALGCTARVEIADDQYGDLFVVVPKERGEPALVRLRY
jgi:broad specificity phosphatase PhoE